MAETTFTSQFGHRLLVEGHQIRLLNADQSLTAASVFMHEDTLDIAEGTVPEGYPEPGLFYQSLGFLDENGNGIRYADFYHNGFPKPPLQGGGGGGGAQGGRGRGLAPRSRAARVWRRTNAR